MAVNMTPFVDIEFLPWYAPGERMLRCEGNTGCGALVMTDDAERHKAFHQDLLDVLTGLALAADL